jgi:hypothetical protein
MGATGATGPQGPAGPAGTTDWNGLTNVPVGFADNSDDVGPSYNAGAGLDLSVNTFSVANGGVSNGMLAANAVDSGKIADGSVSNSDIADFARNLSVSAGAFLRPVVALSTLPTTRSSSRAQCHRSSASTAGV